jgi:hypothetical protein
VSDGHRWRPDAGNLAVEAARNLVAAPARTVLRSVLVLLVVGAGTAAFHARQLDRRSTYLDFLVRGGTVHVVRAPDGIAAAECDRLARQPSVLHAGAVSAVRTVAPRTDPGRLVASYQVSAGFLGVVAPGVVSSADAELHVGGHLADHLGAVPGSQVDVGQGPAIAAVLPPLGRADRFAGAVLVPAPDLVVAECWVEVHPAAGAQGAALVEGLLPVTGAARITPLVATNEFTDVDPDVEPAVGRWWLAGGVALGLVELLVLRQRRRELALYRAVGARRADVTTCTVLEGLLVSVPTAAYALTVASLWSGRAPGLLARDVAATAAGAAGVVGLAGLVLAAGAAVLAHDDTARALRTE